MTAFLEGLGLSEQDISLLYLCPLVSALGSLVHVLMSQGDMRSFKEPKALKFLSARAFFILNALRLQWAIKRLFLGASTGLLLYLYFAGALTQNTTTIFRFLALCLLAGYLSPRLWQFQEQMVSHHIEQLLKKKLDEVFPDVSSRDDQHPLPPRET